MTDFTKRTLLLGFAAALITTPAVTPVWAQSGKNQFSGLITPPSFNVADKARIARATAYLQDLDTAHGRFEQTDFKGRKSAGNWYLARPGKMRFEYDAPTSLLIVSNGKTVSMWDPRLQTFDQYPLSETPLSLFLARQIRFDQGVIVTAVSSNAHGFTLKARDRRKSSEGTVVLGFDQTANGALALREWTITDAQNRATNLKLTSFTRDSAQKADLFVLNKPQKKK
ncbi:LolA family protein [Asticcacaulis sp.]|uniref:LolA family protein n=1 Tax=Asticcacaulis sp. TaxID=1872648 RepID=UPI002B5AA145|nr:outer-membrane lipoprotein carrier protein LolA [Asticcacaulis sp.]HTM80139.1 outer-membrane lipoprotein carrier protein LolA [Asticcacaulis sp.]